VNGLSSEKAALSVHRLHGEMMMMRGRGGGNNNNNNDKALLLVDFKQMPPWVKSIVITLQSSSKLGLKLAKDIYCRSIQSNNPRELGAEQFRFCVDDHHHQQQEQPRQVLYLARLIHRENDAALSSPSSSSSSGWYWQTLGDIGKDSPEDRKKYCGIYCPRVNKILFYNIKANIPATDTQGIFGRAKQGKTDPYLKVFVEYWEKCSKFSTSVHTMASHHGLLLQDDTTTTSTITVKEVIANTPAAESGLRAGDRIVKVLEPYYANFRKGKAGDMMLWLRGLEHNTIVRLLVRSSPQSSTSSSSSSSSSSSVPPPNVCEQAGERTVGMRIGGPIVRKRKELFVSKVFKGMPCPSIIDFQINQKQPIQVVPCMMHGKLRDRRYPCLQNGFGIVCLSCYDRDSMSKDDRIFRHEPR